MLVPGLVAGLLLAGGVLAADCQPGLGRVPALLVGAVLGDPALLLLAGVHERLCVLEPREAHVFVSWRKGLGLFAAQGFDQLEFAFELGPGLQQGRGELRGQRLTGLHRHGDINFTRTEPRPPPAARRRGPTRRPACPGSPAHHCHPTSRPL
jgi:hypothetical protein